MTHRLSPDGFAWAVCGARALGIELAKPEDPPTCLGCFTRRWLAHDDEIMRVILSNNVKDISVVEDTRLACEFIIKTSSHT